MADGSLDVFEAYWIKSEPWKSIWEQLIKEIPATRSPGLCEEIEFRNGYFFRNDSD